MRNSSRALRSGHTRAALNFSRDQLASRQPVVGIRPSSILYALSISSPTAGAGRTRSRADDTAPGTYDLASCRKDLATMLAEAKTRGVESPLVERAFACFDESNKAGWGTRDSSSQAIYWTRRGMNSAGG